MMLVSFGQSSKHDMEMVSIDAGRQIDRSDSHPSKTNSPSFDILQPLSTVRLESLSQDWKQRSEIVSMDDGMQIV
jgi:hypothetical protein